LKHGGAAAKSDLAVLLRKLSEFIISLCRFVVEDKSRENQVVVVLLQLVFLYTMVILSRASTSSWTSCRYTTCGAPLVTKNQILQRFQYKDLEAATGGFDRENLIGRANHGQIYRGVLKDGRVVAVKRPIVGHHLWKDDDAFQNEIEILSKLFSRRLVNLLGYSCDGKVRLLVVEFMENGTLHDLLHGGGGGRAANLSWALRINLALQTAKAIRALHASTPPIIHRNIKASNVYIDRHCCARLGDFGLARYMQHVVSLRSAAGAGRARQSSVNCVLSSISETDDRDLRDQARPWSAVEDWIAYGNVEGPNQTKSEISPKNDVFSFGMLLLELITGSAPVFMSKFSKSVRSFIFFLEFLICNRESAACIFR
jgi:serine/threonine protein kinase